MDDSSFDTVKMNHWLGRVHTGDRAALNELLRRVCGRLEHLADKMLRRFPRVRRWAGTEDILQNALVRLERALRQVRPTSTREFFGLAAEQIRRELLDLARHCYGPHGPATHRADAPWESGRAEECEPADESDPSTDLDWWSTFHQGVANLPAEEREVVGLVFYHGWTQPQIAELFRTTERTVRRRWKSALVKLRQTLADSET